MNKLTKKIKRNKKSIFALALASILTLSFNYSPIALVSDWMKKTASAYKSSSLQTYYANTTTSSESKVSSANFPKELEKYFEPVVEEKRKILSDDEIGNIADENAHRIFEESEVKASVVFGNQLCMAAKLPNGIVIVEVAECDGDDEEDVAMNEDYCSASIVSRIFEFERYRLMHERAASQSEDA